MKKQITVNWAYPKNGNKFGGYVSNLSKEQQNDREYREHQQYIRIGT